MTDADQKSLAWILLQSAGGATSEQHPHLKMSALSQVRQQMLGAHVIRLVQEAERRGTKPERRFSIAYLAALEHFGVDCPHTAEMEHPSYSNDRVELVCQHCGTTVMVDDPENNSRLIYNRKIAEWEQLKRSPVDRPNS